MIALLAVALCGGASLAYAMEGGGHRHGGMHLYRQLNLTDAQKQQIKSLVQAQRATTQPLRQQMAASRVAMLQATANGTFNQAQVQSIANQQAQVMAQLAVARESIQNQIYTQVLTPQQQAQFNQLRTNQINRINQHLQASQQTPAATPAQ
jgi:Spy/CpxP family protein refolding chaperone